MLIRLPKLTGSKTLSPYEQLYHYIAKRLDIPWEKFKDKYSVSDISVNPKTGEILRDNEYVWQWKYSGKKSMGKKWFAKAFAMHWLQHSPKQDRDIPDGKAWVEGK